MSYRESRRYCKVCGRKTVHWRPGSEWRETEPAEGWHVPLWALMRVVRRLNSHNWRCLECDHPWNSSLLR